MKEKGRRGWEKSQLGYRDSVAEEGE